MPRVPCSETETEFSALLAQTEQEEAVPQAVRHYLNEMAELTELAKERLGQIKVENAHLFCNTCVSLRANPFSIA